MVDLGKTTRSRRQIPLSARALQALDAVPPRLDTSLLFPAVRGGLLNLDNWRRREWAPAIEAAGVRRPSRIYDLRSTFASNALAAGVSVFELARIMGTSAHMIERSYGVLIEGAAAVSRAASTPSTRSRRAAWSGIRRPELGPSSLTRVRPMLESVVTTDTKEGPPCLSVGP